MSPGYDPFAPGASPVRRSTIELSDATRGRSFPVDIWNPERGGSYPLLIYSHSSGGNRRSSTFLCRHLASHGYVVAAMDHSERVTPELAGRDGESDAQRGERIAAIIASRVPDIRFLLDQLLSTRTIARVERNDVSVDPQQIGLIGHSFGGWTVLATPEVEPRVGSIAALVPGGSSRPMPGILPVTLSFARVRSLPTLYLAAENDVMIPLDRVVELFERTPGLKRMYILRRADHQHFVDDVAGEHEALRGMTLPGEAAWIPGAMRPMAELTTGPQAHLFVNGLTLAHFDETLRGSTAAEEFLDGQVEEALAARGIEGMRYP